MATPIDVYCERTDPSFWSEPVNALTNIAFLVAAAAAFLAWRQSRRELAVLLLIAVTAAVGVGSFIFHTVATRESVLFDTIPIAMFIYGYLLWVLRRLFGLSWLWAIAGVLIFAVAAQAFILLIPLPMLGGSQGYLPPLAALAAIGWLLSGKREGRIMLATAGVFLISLAFRTADRWVCDTVPLGTHFLWHLLNGLVLYLLLNAAIHALPHRKA